MRINYLSDALDTRKIREDALRRMAQGSVSPYARRSDLSGLCSVPDPFASGVGYPAVRGYRYEGHPAAGTAGKGGFNLADFGKELLTGFVAGGLSSAAFYGAGKAVEALKGSVRSAGRGNLSNVGKPNSGQGFSPKGYTPQQGERTIDGYVKQNANPEISLYTNSAGFNNNNGNIGGQFKRFGAESGHGINGPHVHQPLRNVAPDNSVYGDVGSKTKNGGVTSPTAKDVKQLYEYIKMVNTINKGGIMNEEQRIFYNELRKIQDFAIGTSLGKQSKYKKIEDLLEDITYDVIYMICEMIDGYRNDLLQYDVVNVKSGNVINDKIALHDWCEEYLKCTDI